MLGASPQQSQAGEQLDIRPHLAVASCFGGGGPFGLAFTFGAATALQQAGVHVVDGPMLGTSAGSWTAAALAAGLSFEDVLTCWTEHRGRRRTTRAIDLSYALFGNRRDGRVAGMAVDVATGQRVALSGARHALADVVAASSSAPRLTKPHRLGPRRYVDGGVSSVTSADFAEPAPLLVVATPIARRVSPPMGRMFEHRTRYEIRLWRYWNQGQVFFLRPDSTVAALAGRGRGGLFNVAAAPDVFEAAQELTQRRIRTVAGRVLHAYMRHPVLV